MVSLYFVAGGDSCPSASTAARGPRWSQPWLKEEQGGWVMETRTKELRRGGRQTGQIPRGAARKVIFYFKGSRNLCVVHQSQNLVMCQEFLIPTVADRATVHGVAET